jgi:hypothetical protein
MLPNPLEHPIARRATPSRRRGLLRATTLALPLLLGLHGLATAAVLVTPPVQPVGDQRIQCGIVNTASAERTVTISWIDEDGNVVTSTGELTLAPGGAYSIYTSFAIERYCRFDVQGVKDAYRAHLVVIDASTGEAQATAEAR